MPSNELDVAVGATFSMAGTGLSARKMVDFTPPGGEVEMLPASHQGTVDALDFIAADLPDFLMFEFVVHHQQDYDWTADLGKKVLTDGCVFTGPSGATASFNGVFAGYKPQRATLNETMLADVTIKITSKPVIVAA